MFFRKKRENAKIKKLSKRIEEIKKQDYHIIRIQENTNAICHLRNQMRELQNLYWRFEEMVSQLSTFYKTIDTFEENLCKLELMVVYKLTEEEALKRLKEDKE